MGDIIAERGWPPIIWTRADRYRFGASAGDVEQYIRGQVRKKLGEIRRLMTGTVAPQLAEMPKAKWIGYASTMLAAVEWNLDMLDALAILPGWGPLCGLHPGACPFVRSPGAWTLLPLGHDECRMGVDRAVAAVPVCEKQAGGRPEKHPRREIVDAIHYVVDTGCKWRALPRDFPPWRTVYGFMARWAAAGVIGQIRDQLRARVRRQVGRAPRAVAIVIDSQSVRAAETLGKDSRGWDAAKKVNGRKRHLVVDTHGLLLFVMVTPADVSGTATRRRTCCSGSG